METEGRPHPWAPRCRSRESGLRCDGVRGHAGPHSATVMDESTAEVRHTKTIEWESLGRIIWRWLRESTGSQ